MVLGMRPRQLCPRMIKTYLNSEKEAFTRALYGGENPLAFRGKFWYLKLLLSKACYLQAFIILTTFYMVTIVQSVRTPGCGPGGRGFKSHWSPTRNEKFSAIFLADNFFILHWQAPIV